MFKPSDIKRVFRENFKDRRTGLYHIAPQDISVLMHMNGASYFVSCVNSFYPFNLWLYRLGVDELASIMYDREFFTESGQYPEMAHDNPWEAIEYLHSALVQVRANLSIVTGVSHTSRMEFWKDEGYQKDSITPGKYFSFLSESPYIHSLKGSPLPTLKPDDTLVVTDDKPVGPTKGQVIFHPAIFLRGILPTGE